ncbi:MAG: response regulator [Treponema sp.]|jgi:two-component system response regulator YesN|nr:response regulator [Treponema sp.]
MYKVLIVDDEEPVLESYSFMLEGDRDFTVAGTARSGYQALELIYQREPDLVFMDINIPGMDGLAVIADVYQKFPGMVFVLSTAYERFDLAQRAIPLGVFAYLVKPVSKKTFLATLDKVREHLDGQTWTAAQEEADPMRRLLRGFLRKVLWQEIQEDDWERYRTRFGLPSDKGIVCLVEAGHSAVSPARDFPPGAEEPAWSGRIAERLAYRHRCFFDTLVNRGLFLISEDIDREVMERHLTAALREVFPPPDFPDYGIGGCYRGPELYKSCVEALTELGNKRKGADTQSRERLRLAQLRRKIGIADAGAVKKLFGLLWEDIFAGNDFTLAKAKMIPVFMFLLDDCTGCYQSSSGGDPPGGRPLPFSPAEDIMAVRDMAEWEAWSAGAFETILRMASLRRSGNFPLPLIKAMEYIHDHYTKTIQLGDAAEAALVSTAYLSRLFSEHLKTNFVDYLTEMRIERAEKLIRESRMSIKEVARAVGYQDPNYFSKIFRKVTGMLPTQYAG